MNDKKSPTSIVNFLEQMGMKREDLLTEAAPQVLASKMTVLGFVEQASYFLDLFKKSLVTSPHGLEVDSTLLLVQAIKQALSDSETGLERYREIRDISRALTKIKLARESANDNDLPDAGNEVYDFVPNHPKREKYAKEALPPTPDDDDLIDDEGVDDEGVSVRQSNPGDKKLN